MMFETELLTDIDIHSELSKSKWHLGANSSFLFYNSCLWSPSWCILQVICLNSFTICHTVNHSSTQSYTKTYMHLWNVFLMLLSGLSYLCSLSWCVSWKYDDLGWIFTSAKACMCVEQALKNRSLTCSSGNNANQCIFSGLITLWQRIKGKLQERKVHPWHIL